MPEIEGVNHIALTVSDIDASAAWYIKVFDAQKLMDDQQEAFDRVVLLAPPIVIGMTKHKAGADADRFDESRIGLDHVSFGVPDRAALDVWVAHLDALGVAHEAINDAPYGSTLVVRDPDNIQLEFFALPG